MTRLFHFTYNRDSVPGAEFDVQKESTARNACVSPRAVIALLIYTAVCSILGGTLPGSFRPDAPVNVSHRALTFEERVSHQRAIEEVYWRHRIWPKESPNPKPSLDAVMSQAQIGKKVADYLRNSQALEDYWQRPIITEQLQAEMDRMAKNSKQPEVLRELFEALGNDPFVIAECLARPALAERLVTSWYAYDQRIHSELKQRAEVDLQEHPTVEQMKQLSGKYTEIELIKSDNAEEENSHGIEHGLKLNTQVWDATVQKLAAMFNDCAAAAGESGAKAASNTQIKTGVLSPLQEDEGRYYAAAVIEKTTDRLRLATVGWSKEPFESWRARARENQKSKTMVAATASYTLPAMSDEASTCTDDAWAPSSLNTPIGRTRHTAVWTGSEMIIWGGYGGLSFKTGGRYNPSTDAWTLMSTPSAPSERAFHTALWTGSEMIVWGGGYYAGSGIIPVNTGGRYNPNTDSWTATSTVNAPTARWSHTAVWTGSELIVWGGEDSNYVPLNTGGRYNASTGTWTVITTANAPSARAFHRAVWTGSHMIVWGGYDPSNVIYVGTGGTYNPSTNSWTTTSITNAPTGRQDHTAIWTGSEMIIWGGNGPGNQYFNTGGRYNPNTNSWTATSTTNAPDGRELHTAVWSGNEMIVWGGAGDGGYVSTGGRYSPATDNWVATSLTNAPPRRWVHTAVWTGTEMIVWGGVGGNGNAEFLSTGARYNPTTNTWAPNQPPDPRVYATAVWTGTEMIVWGGDGPIISLNTGGKYDPGTDSWIATSTTNAPTARVWHSAVWSGTEMIVWGGYNTNNGHFNTGGRYNPGTNSWAATSITNAPAGRSFHTAVWSGSEMIIWGGIGLDYFNTGGKYSPNTNTWAATSTVNAPTARSIHTAVWTGNEMIVWGGQNDGSNLNTGGRYRSITNTWTITGGVNAPTSRSYHTAVWTGNEMIVWGGRGDSLFNTGARYNPNTNSWTATSTINAPDARYGHTAVWTGSEMIVWSGSHFPYWLNTGGRYNPGTNSWRATSTNNAPIGYYGHTAVWTGNEMIVWGGISPFGYSNSGGTYCAESSPTPTPTPAPRPTPRPRPSLPPRQTPPPR